MNSQGVPVLVTLLNLDNEARELEQVDEPKNGPAAKKEGFWDFLDTMFDE